MTKKINIWQLLWQLIRYAFKLYLADAFFWLFIAGLPILSGLIIREFFNSITEKHQVYLSPWIFIVLLIVVGIGRVIFIFIGRVTKTQHRFTMSALLRNNLLQAIIKLPDATAMRTEKESHNTIGLGEIISYFRDDITLLEDIVVGTSELFDAGIFACMALVILASINWQMTAFIFLPVVVIILFIHKMEIRIKRYRRASRMTTEKVTGLIGEIFNSIQAIKISGAENSVISYFQYLSKQRHKTMLADQLLTAILNSSFQNIVNLGTGIMLLFAANIIQNKNGSLTVGDFSLFVYYLAFITDFVTYLGDFIATSKQAEVSFERMINLLENSINSSDELVAHQPLYLNNIQGKYCHLPKLEPPQQTHPRLQELTIKSLTYHYQGSKQGIENINFCLQRGSLNVMTGDIGAGKTTVLGVLLGVLPLQAGEIYWNDRLVNHPASFFIPPRSAYTPQIPHFFSQSLRDNLLLGWQTTKHEIEKSLEYSVFTEDIATMPLGLDTPVGYKGVRLSGGQLQRAAIARALIRQPELLVFDDISSALDIQTEIKLYQRLRDIQIANSEWQPTILIVSHNQWLCDRADQVITLDRGHIRND
ncbi:ABC transporter ATP-binding protein [Calothrix sp. UHCC 0171]|uniref:ABC transporter ATP-binding protein n=1 Tax=Calothrix sp. UHCC 0171 TaxID=3110245 RepID=UPI002B20DA09|nr:ABC transporter ATP-binding protein [Calothrix sp. UHCC 0171]MEA5574043.1 ABC transporter ATP-binding protein [Calothrix sp. UHCC 0171]